MKRQFLAMLGFAGFFLASQKSIAEVQYFYNNFGNPRGQTFSLNETAPGVFQYELFTTTRGNDVLTIYHDPVKIRSTPSSRMVIIQKSTTSEVIHGVI